MNKLLNMHDVLQLIGCSVTTIDRWEKLGLFPKRFKINLINARWDASEVIEWIERKKKAPFKHRNQLTIK